MLQGLPTADQGRPWMALGMKTLAGSAQRQPVTGRTGKQAHRQAGRLSGIQPVGGSSSGSSPDGSLMSPGLRTSHADRFCGLSPMQACRHANRHTGRRANCHDCGQASELLERRAAASWLQESLGNMKASAVCYNFRHIPFDVSATLCLNDAPDAGRISEAFTTASLDLGLPAVHRLPQRH